MHHYDRRWIILCSSIFNKLGRAHCLLLLQSPEDLTHVIAHGKRLADHGMLSVEFSALKYAAPCSDQILWVDLGQYLLYFNICIHPRTPKITPLPFIVIELFGPFFDLLVFEQTPQ